ncbi:MAG: bifunctional demethylmenaquinone methyltransferase/2-methoxy-6-polyprenyl-1,4-benzoquinol methylase UbiE [Burkholderiales bacterium]|nr:bifunctional demethylmenaquinone methyltransferase/2-methoxy-6-polyprenyl-1,4-benzoquinol methylase UbiE [Burkholderiales bacterium]
MKPDRPTTHFGYQQVPETEKAQRVAQVFDSVASRYDVMNDLMSGGLHRLWKRILIERCGLRPGERALDLAGGTGDISALLRERVGSGGQVVMTDINREMLRNGRDRLLDAGVALPIVQCDAEALPFSERSFDCVTIAFGLRNVTRKERALAEMRRVLRVGGRALVLEFSQVWQPLRPLYDVYSFGVLPWLGKLVAGDARSYRYLAESIRMHPGQEQLRDMMQGVGFERVDYLNLTAGVVALHRGYRL